MQSRIGKYRLLDQVAIGGQGTVYRAWDTDLGQVIALKVLHPHLATDLTIVERFRREAQLAASITHRNVTRIFEVGQDGDRHFIAMEYLPVSVHGILEAEGKLSIERSVEICIQASAALGAANEHGIIHRDIKPQNLLLTTDGTIKVSDFGIARASHLTTMTQTGALMGTPRYMSPEQARGQRVDTRSDIYSLGIVLYELLTGSVPFDADTPLELMRQHVSERPDSVRLARSEVPEPLERTVNICLEKDPALRFQSHGELAAALRQATPERPFQAPDSSAMRCETSEESFREWPESTIGGTVAEASTESGGAASLTTSDRRGGNRRRKVWAIAGLTIATMLVLMFTGLILRDQLSFPLASGDGGSAAPPVLASPPSATPSIAPVSVPAPASMPADMKRTPTPTPVIALISNGRIEPPPTTTPSPVSVPVALDRTPTPRPAIIEPTATLAPDLVIDHVSLEPSRPAVGDSVNFEVIVKNQGTGVSGPSDVTISLPGTDRDGPLGIDIPELEPGMSVGETFEWELHGGEPRAVVVVDPRNIVAELDETNNKRTFRYGEMDADLIVESMSWSPTNPSKGATVRFTVKVMNQGFGDAQPSDIEYFVDGSSKRHARDRVSSLPSGQSTSEEFNWVAEAGTHSFRAVADAYGVVTETDESNNELQTHYDATALPDLIVDSITWTPPNPSIGDKVTFTVTIKNQGHGNSRSSTVNYYVDGSTRRLTGDRVDALAPGQSATAGFTWQAETGSHRFRAVADAYGVVTETDESNNELETDYEATALPDLIVESITWTPPSPSIGDKVTFTVTIKNQGHGNSRSSTVNYYVDGSTRRLTGDRVDALAPGQSATAGFTWQAETGSHRFRAVADAYGVVTETDESNNELETDYEATALPDLIVESITWTPPSPSIGDKVTFTVTINNQGHGNSRSSTVNYYVDGSTRRLTRDRVDALAPGQSATAGFTWQAETGSHRFRAVADAYGVVTETDESNNEFTVTLR